MQRFVSVVLKAIGHRNFKQKFVLLIFKNNPEDVARYFHYHLVENPQFSSFFEKVVFAVLDNTKDESVINAFRNRF